MTAAATASSTVSLPPVCGLTDDSRDASAMPPSAATLEQITKPDNRTSGSLMPARRAASALPPTA